MFLGTYQHNLDAKGRLIIPSKYRNDLGLRCVISKGLDGCLYIFPMDVWEELAQKLEHLPIVKKDARRFTRVLFSSASELEVDKQGRIPIPENLQKYAGLEKEVSVIGMSNRLEIWSDKTWQDFEDDSEGTFEELAETMHAYDIGF